MTTLHVVKSISRAPLPRRSFSEGGSPITYHYPAAPKPSEGGSLLTVLLLALSCFALWPASKAFGVTPPPVGGYPGENTATGTNALYNDDVRSGGANTANGYEALYSNTIGPYNTATGSQALYSNTFGSHNTATGAFALSSNTTGSGDTATGLEALVANTTGGDNTANGDSALASNTIGSSNTADGASALASNTTGIYNTANGVQALAANTTGGDNTANGVRALLFNTTGLSNIAVGFEAGRNLTTGNNNIDIGNLGVAAEAHTIRIGDANQTRTFIAGIGPAAFGGSAVYVNSDGQLGTRTSSARFKQDIHSMDKASEAILALKPVTFRYKQELDPKGIPQFGLVAEEVEKVNPDLVARDDQGKVYTVRYEAVNAMLLNEFLKEHRKVEEQDRTVREQKAAVNQLKSAVTRQEATIAQQQRDFQATIGKLEATIARQQKGMEILTARLEEQASQIQKVSAQLELSKSVPQMAGNDR